MVVTDAPPLSRLTPYVSSAVLARLGHGAPDALAPVERVRGAVLLLDIAGFTPMVVSLSGLGPRGIDALQRLFVTSYTELVEGVRAWGGDVYQFAGDSILALFEAAPGEEDTHVALRAASCALGLQRRLTRYRDIETLGQRFAVSARIGLGHGDCHRLLLGAHEPWCHPALIGAPLEHAVAAEKRATAGEVVVSPEFWALLPPARGGEPIKDGFHRVESVPEPTGWTPVREQPLGAGQERRWAEACARLINPLLLRKVATEHQDFTGELRDITSLFVRFSLREPDARPLVLAEQLDRVYTQVQREAATYGGVLLMTDFTDKGHVFYVLFGAPTAQPNKEVLACRLACRLLQKLEALPFLAQVQMGIATGPAYCGDLGSPTRKGYSTLGEGVNLAARLMTFGRDSAIYTEAHTERRLRQGFATEALEDVSLKGLVRPMTLYRIRSEVRKVCLLLTRDQGELIGRRTELDTLREAARTSLAGAGQVCVVSGEAGIGKSRLSNALVQEAEALGARALYGICYPYEKFTPFFPWKEVLAQLLQVEEVEGREGMIAKMHRALDGLEEAGPEWVAVLAGLLGLPVMEDARTHSLEARLKNQRLFQIIFRLLERASLAEPLVIVFEDLHWADNISLDLLEHVAGRLGTLRLMVLATTRPDCPLHALRERGPTVELTRLDEEDARMMLRRHLRLEPPDLPLERMLLAKVQGNPFFIESIVQGLVEQRHLIAEPEGRRSLRHGLQDIQIPDTIQDVVLARLDLLPELEQVVVKVASVIGRVFTLDAMQALLPDTRGLERLQAACGTLTALGLAALEFDEPITFVFTHIVIRDVAYNTLLVSAREELHRRLAGYLEARAGEHRARSAGSLAYHFLAGSEDHKGLEYTLLAARGAKAQYANEDAVHHYQRALEVLSTTTALTPEQHASLLTQVMRELAETLLQKGSYQDAILMFEQCLSEESTREERARVYVGLGRAHQEKGESEQAIQQLERALVLLGRQVPRTRGALRARIAGRLGLHLLGALWPSLWRRISPERRPTYLQQLSTLISLIRIYYFVDAEKLVWATLVAYGMAERSRSDHGRSLASGYTTTLYAGAGMPKRGARQGQRALEYAHRSQDMVAEGIALSRQATHLLFVNETHRSVERMERSLLVLRQVGEPWEVQTSLMILGTGYFLSSRFEEAEQTYARMGALGREHHALMHQGWAHAWEPFCRYLRGLGEVRAQREEMEQGLSISLEVNDLANQCACLNHLANVAVREGEVEEAARAAVRGFERVWRYHVLVPFLQVGLVDAAEAALFALEGGAQAVPRRKLLRVARWSCVKARLLGRVYPYLRGPALRVTARYRALTRGPRAAEPLFQEAIACLERTPNRWELGVACLDAALALPHRREELLGRARELFTEVGAKAELRRLQKAWTHRAT